MESEVYAQPIDALEYTYHPDKKNQLVKVYDSTLEPVGFSDGNNGTNTDYAYDEFGNMTGDLNKGIDLIAYNHLNLPVSISFSNGGRIEYLYTASGSKVQKKVFIPAPSQVGGSVITAMDYLGGFQYQDNVLKHFPTAEGYVSHVSGSYQYVFNYTDHLGNIRLSYGLDSAEAKLKIMEENHYYPFGMKHANYNTHTLSAMKKEESNEITLKAVAAPSSPKPVMGYNYKYNGKEYQDELGLNLYDYGARNYDAAIGRWMNMDPMAEKYRRWSPYNYCVDNPVYFIDPDGMEVVKNWYGDTYTEADAEYLFAQLKSQMSSKGSATDPPSRKAGSIPKGMSEKESLQDIVVIDGKKYYKNTSNIFAEAGNSINNFFGGSDDYFVEHKEYDKADESFINEAVDQSAGGLAGFGLGKALSSIKFAPNTSMSSKILQLSENMGIKSGQKGINPEIVEQYYQQMVNQTYKTAGGAGFQHKEMFILTDGNHKMIAALRYGIEWKFFLCPCSGK